MNPTKEQIEMVIRKMVPDDLVQGLLRQMSETFPNFESGGPKMIEAARRAAAFIGAAWDMRTKLVVAIGRCKMCPTIPGPTPCAGCQRVLDLLDKLK